MRRQSGWSLVELLVVISVLLVLVSMAIPALQSARRASNHAAAAAAIHTLVVAQNVYQEAYPAVGYTNTLANLGPPSASGCPTPAKENACNIDWTLAQAFTGGNTGSRGGYVYNVIADDAGSGAGVNVEFMVSAAPLTNQIGTKAFCATDSGEIRVNDTGTVTSPATTRDDCITNYKPLQ